MDYEESNEERRGDLIELMIALSTIFGFTGSLVLIVYASYSGNEIIDTPILLMLITVIIRAVSYTHLTLPTTPYV